ncbi:MAG: metallophosphoesterase [Promethearchaeota archaeon]
MSTENKSKDILKKTLKITFSAINLVVVGFLIFFMITLFNLFQNEVIGRGFQVILGFAAAGFSIIVMIILDRNKKMQTRLTWKRLCFRWFVIAPAALSFGLITLLILLGNSSINFQDFESTDLNSEANLQFIVYFVIYFISQLFVVYLYFAIKNLIPKMKIHKVKFPIFAAIGTLTLVGFGYLSTTFIGPAPDNVMKEYEYNDGPWITWSNDPKTSACITWLTNSTKDTHLSYGLSPSSLSTTLKAERSGHVHRVYLTNLSPDTKYYYKIDVAFERYPADTVFSFKTAPDADRPFKVAMIGDMQPYRDSNIPPRNALVMEGIVNASPDLFIQLGDAANTGGFAIDWHLVLNSLVLGASTIPMMIAVGNHDYGGDMAANYGRLFKYPYPNFMAGKYYSFDYLNAHFTIIDSNRLTETQVKWIESDLSAAASSSDVDWIFCFFHTSLISSGTANSDWQAQTKLVPLFDKYGVDAVFYGHDHHYEHFNYTYGSNGLVHDPSHNWTHHSVHYFESGGGGAHLEAESYGLLTLSPYHFNRTWYNASSGKEEVVTYYRNPWNNSVYKDYSANSTLSNVAPNGKVYYQEPSEEIYQSDITQYGYVYGEDSFHYMLIEINGTTCTISARYPSGDLMTGPGGSNPQVVVLNKP